MFGSDVNDVGEEKLFSKRRIRNIILGVVVAFIAGLVLANTFTYVQYGGTMFDKYFKKEKRSPAAGKFAYAKGTDDYVGIIRDEGTSPSKGKVYYIEQAGGSMAEFRKELIEVREPEKHHPEKQEPETPDK
ncbi:MAG TPA: hypothetical protein VF762_23150 [Blastocatellia bacterium]|jgi:hypothetical protein